VSLRLQRAKTETRIHQSRFLPQLTIYGRRLSTDITRRIDNLRRIRQLEEQVSELQSTLSELLATVNNGSTIRNGGPSSRHTGIHPARGLSSDQRRDSEATVVESSSADPSFSPSSARARPAHFPATSAAPKRPRLQQSPLQGNSSSHPAPSHRPKSSTLRSTLEDEVVPEGSDDVPTAAPFEVAEAAAVSTEGRSTSTSLHSNGFDHASPFLDVVDKGIVTMDQARELFDVYATSSFLIIPLRRSL
jgi:hypothetical protein